MLRASSWSQAREKGGWRHGPCHRSAGSAGSAGSGESGESAEIVPGRFCVRMAQIWSPREQQSRRFVASMSPRSHRLAVLEIPCGVAQIWSPGEQESRRFVASMSPRSRRFAILVLGVQQSPGFGASKSPRSHRSKVLGPNQSLSI